MKGREFEISKELIVFNKIRNLPRPVRNRTVDAPRSVTLLTVSVISIRRDKQKTPVLEEHRWSGLHHTNTLVFVVLKIDSK